MHDQVWRAQAVGCFQAFLRLGSLVVSCISHSVTAAAGTRSLQGSSSLLNCFPQPYLLSTVLTAQRRHRNVGRWGLHLAHAIVSFRSALRLWFLSRGRKAATTSSCSVTRSYSFRPHGLQHTRLPCPSLSPGVCPSSCALHRWCHPTNCTQRLCQISCEHAPACWASCV